MRQSFFILSFCILILLGCKKSVTNVDIYRQWKWENSIGGFTGIDTIKPSQNSTVSLTFKNDMTYSTELNGQIISHGTFQILTIHDQKVLQANNFLPIEGLWLENNGARMRRGLVRLLLVPFLFQTLRHIYYKSRIVFAE